MGSKTQLAIDARLVTGSGCKRSLFGAVDRVEVLIVDTPWLAPLLMHICEIVFIGSMHFPGEQNYMVVAQAAVASCAVVASSSVMAHVQLAQELNNAAVNAAEDAAHAVRTAGGIRTAAWCVNLHRRLCGQVFQVKELFTMAP